MNIEEIYTDLILDLFKNPLNKKKISNPDSTHKDSNRFCGDVIEIQLKFEKGKIKEIGFQGDGCAISQASASILTEMAKNKKIEDALKININDVLKELHLEKLKKNPVRIKCALLPTKVFKIALLNYIGKNLKNRKI